MQIESPFDLLERTSHRLTSGGAGGGNRTHKSLRTMVFETILFAKFQHSRGLTKLTRRMSFSRSSTGALAPVNICSHGYADNEGTFGSKVEQRLAVICWRTIRAGHSAPSRYRRLCPSSTYRLSAS